MVMRFKRLRVASAIMKVAHFSLAMMATQGHACNNSGNLTLNGVTLRNNFSSENGGAILNAGGDITIDDSFIISNEALAGSGGAIGTACNQSSTIITNTFISGNRAGGIFAGEGGGAMIIWSGASVNVRNSVIAGNSATGDGGGAFYMPGAGNLTLHNSTVVGNYVAFALFAANTGGGIQLDDASGNAFLYNSIVWGNYAPSSPVLGGPGTYTVNASGIEDGYAGTSVTTLLSSDQVFADARPATEAPTTAGDFHLALNSPAFNAGDNSLIPGDITTDFDGDNRILDTTVDLGADEGGFCNEYPWFVGTAEALASAIDCANTDTTPRTILLLNDIELTEVKDTTLGNNGLPSITTPIIINGKDNELYRNEAVSETFRIFHVADTGILNLKDITLSNGMADETNGGMTADQHGGAIYNAGTLIVENSLLQDNYALTLGGAIFASTATTTTIDTTDIFDNNAAYGGAIRNVGDVTITNSRLKGNRATNWGGGIHNGGTLTIQNSTIAGNYAVQNTGGVFNAGTLALEQSTVAGNADGNGVAGGINNYQTNTATIANSVIWGNSSPQIALGTGTFTMDYSAVQDQTLTGTGNLTLSSTDQVFIAPRGYTFAPRSDGDYRLLEDSPVIDIGRNSLIPAGITTDLEGDNRIENNTVDMGSDEFTCSNIQFPYRVDDPGSLRVGIECANEQPGANTLVFIDDVSISDIYATTANGKNGTPVISSTIIIQGNGHVLDRDSETTDEFRLFELNSSGRVAIIDLTIQNGKLSDGGTAGSGGAIFVGGGSLTLDGVTIDNNNISGGDGGAIYQDGGRGIILDSTFTNNSAGADGGAIALDGGADYNVYQSIISGNDAASEGGGAYLADAQLTILNSLISGNRATGRGGGLVGAETTSILTLRNSTLAGNYANLSNGGILMYTNATLNGYNSILWGNDAPASPQGSFGTNATVEYTAVQDALPTGTGNIQLSASNDIFVAPEVAPNAPTTAGNYHMVRYSSLINMGNNASAGVSSVDIDGDARIIDGVIDLGADEVTDPCPVFPVTVVTDAELIEAIECANINGITDTIELDDDIMLTAIDNTTDGNNGLPSITSAIVIIGNNNLLERSNAVSDTFRIFHVAANGTLELSDVTLSNGLADETNGGINEDDDGGAIFARGDLTIDNSIFQNNSAGFGGALATPVVGAGTITITNSQFLGNSATANNNVDGGGGAIASGATLTLTNSIVTGNYALYRGGGVYNRGSSSTMDIYNSTISGNDSDNSGAGVYNLAGTVNIYNSIIWGNFANFGSTVTNNGTATLSYTAIEGGLASSTGNNPPVDGGGNIDLSGNADIFVAPEPASNAPTTAGDYHLTNTSVAINKGNTALVPAGITTDFEGDYRFLYVNVDMGADEVNFCTAISFPYMATTADELIRAMACANSTPAEDTINVSGTISVMRVDNNASGNNGLPNIVQPLIIQGVGGQAVIQRSTATSETFRLFHVGKNKTFTLQDVTLRNGHVTETNPNITSDDDGGAFLNRGTSTLINVLIHGNRADGVGGGFYNLQGTSTLENVTIAGNYANFGGGMRVYAGVVTMENSLVWGNQANAGANQIANTASLNLQSTGVESLTTVNYTGLGNNKGLSGNWNIFVNPEPAANAPTIDGDYHLANLSKAVNGGDNSLIPAGVTTDWEGTDRILNSVVDMGADERPFNLPPQNENLVFNPTFDFPGNNLGAWSEIGSIVATINSEGVNLQFPSVVDGWLRQIRGAYQLQIDLKMVAWVKVNNPNPTTRTFQFFMKDTNGTTADSYLCSYSIGGNATGIYYMQFLTQSDWEAMRIDIRPNFAGANGLNFDDVNVRYRPNAPFTETKVCVSPAPDEAPAPPPETELVTAQHAMPIQADDGVSCNTLDWTGYRQLGRVSAHLRGAVCVRSVPTKSSLRLRGD